MMIKTMDKMLLSVEKQEEEEIMKEEEGQVIGNDNEEEQTIGGEKEAVVPQATGEKIPSPVQNVEKKQQPNVLNLNNEVVNMRKEVRRVRVFVIRKLIRQMASLKGRKGREMNIERNHRRAARLLEEIHCMKHLKPDLVTKTALQKTLNFEEVCKNPKSTISDRAIARIATHPQFSKKIESIKAAVKAFKDDRLKSLKLEGKPKVQKQPKKATLASPEKKVETRKKNNNDDRSVEPPKITADQKVGDVQKDNKIATPVNSQMKMKIDHHLGVHMQEMSTSVDVRPVSLKEDLEKHTPQTVALSVPAALQERADDDNSDVELSDNEEREYFDDSTEERFYKQSSQSEESDDDNFFLGKVTTFKKKKKKKNSEGEKSEDKAHNVKKDNKESPGKLQSELDELEARLKPKATALQSVFCSSLADSKSGGGVSRGRGGGKFRGKGIGQEKHSRNQPWSKKHEKGSSESKYSLARPESKHPDKVGKGGASGGRGRGRGRGDFRGQKDRREEALQPVLHPSWEASKKRKEQQGQILAFQGKKTKFDDDD